MGAKTRQSQVVAGHYFTDGQRLFECVRIGPKRKALMIDCESEATFYLDLTSNDVKLRPISPEQSPR